jgi:hypothetical protein
MKTATLVALVAGLAASPAAAAPKAAKAQQACFWPSQAQEFAPMGRSAVNLKVAGGDIYQLQLAGECPNIDWRRNIGIRPHSVGRVCAGQKAEIVTRTELSALQCAVKSIRRLTPAEIEALPEDARPR